MSTETPLDALPKGEREKLARLVKHHERANHPDRQIHPETPALELYAVVHGGRLLWVHQHDPNGPTPLAEAVRSTLVGQHPELVDEDGAPVKPEMIRFEPGDIIPQV
jgi:hypothetical protein